MLIILVAIFSLIIGIAGIVYVDHRGDVNFDCWSWDNFITFVFLCIIFTGVIATVSSISSPIIDKEKAHGYIGQYLQYLVDDIVIIEDESPIFPYTDYKDINGLNASIEILEEIRSYNRHISMMRLEDTSMWTSWLTPTLPDYIKHIKIVE